LQHGKTKREESRVRRNYCQRIDAHIRLARSKEETGQLLLGKPIECLATQVCKFRLERITKARFIRRGVISYDQTVWVAAAHVWVQVICRNPVSHPHNLSLNHPTVSWNIIGDFKRVTSWSTAGQINQLIDIISKDNFWS